MNAARFWRNASIVLLALILIGQCFEIVDQREQAVVLRFGQPVRVFNTPGLTAKIPFAEQVVSFDRRIQTLQTEPEQIATAGQRPLMVDAVVRYRIEDPLRFWRAVRDQKTAAARLNKMTVAALRQTLAGAGVQDIVSGRREALDQQARDTLARQVAASGIGVRIVDLRIRRANLTVADQNAVFARMSAAWRQEAAQARAGTEQQRQTILDKGRTNAAAIRDDAAAERGKIYASSYGRDPSFAAFYQTMQAYKETLARGDTTVMLPPDSEFLKYLQGGPQPANSSAR